MSVPNPVVCLPTYNERENLEKMVRALGDKGVDVLVIDDSSPDGTGEIADRLAAELPWVDVLHRARKDRSALRDGSRSLREARNFRTKR